ncbi:1758_t:CDS:2 [Funneliformis caledonium]|uniref:1758_t:CDS:1 n=1 Tax=Funneliformis caledonium TaxID=1117310 RepID=A0A9N9BTC4_9GLOM|nr:1758_t:CDS:2 [Funneliformis caledonium]
MVKWKREKVQDHKFDFVDVQEFEKDDFISKIKYSFVFFIVLKSVLVYIADIYNAGALLVTDKWAGGVKPKIPFIISKWIVVGSIFISFVLLLLEVRKARLIVASRDISFAFTSIVAYRYYTLTSYAHWCFFQEIRNQQKGQDKIAFFVFFSFKGWKRLLFCDGPRQVINAMTLFTIFKEKGFTSNFAAYGPIFTRASMGVIIFTVSMFIISACLLLFAFLLYLPLLCKIRGNLKEYCCHLIDKRISELLKRQKYKRIQKGSKAVNTHFDGLAPTIPNVDVDDPAQNKVPYITTPPPIHPYHDPPPMVFNNFAAKPPADPYILGRPNAPRNQVPHYNVPPPQGIYTNHNNGSTASLENGGFNAPYRNRRGSNASLGIVPIYDQPVGMEYPPRPDKNAYDSYPVSPQSQQFPQNNFVPTENARKQSNNAVPPAQRNPYPPRSPHKMHFAPTETARQQNNNAVPPAQRNPYPPRSPHKTHFSPNETARQQTTNAIPPSQRNPHPSRTTHSQQKAHSNARYQQNPHY